MNRHQKMQESVGSSSTWNDEEWHLFFRPGICEKYGVEPDSQLVEDEPKNVTWR